MCYVILWILSILNHLNLSLYYTFGNKKLPQTEMYDKIIYGFGVHFHLWFWIIALRVDSTGDFFILLKNFTQYLYVFIT